MQLHWYWPFARREELSMAHHALRVGDSVVIQTIDRAEAPAAGIDGNVTVVRDLPDVRRSVSHPARWAASRANTYRRRATARHALWKSADFDLVHLHYINRFTDAVASMPRPLVLSVHDVVPHVARLGPFERRLLGRVYHRADALVVHHTRLADALIRDFGIGSPNVHVVPLQVCPVDSAPPGATADSSPVSSADRESSPPTLLFFGALRPNKGVAVLAAAMEELRDLDVRLVIAGRGDARVEQQVRALAERDPRVSTEIGFATLERKWELFGSAALVVLPYTSFASQSAVLTDAYGHGRPVVATDVGALGETVREDGTGIVVPPGDARLLAEGIRRALEPSVREAHGRAARRVRIERSPQAAGRALRAVYDDVLR